MKEINLQEIAKKHLDSYDYHEDIDYSNNIINYVTKAMREACEQALELAAKNARVTDSMGEDFYHVDEQSILNTINQIK